MPEPQSTATVQTERTQTDFQREQEREFLLDFINKSDRLRTPFIPIWDEVRDNYLLSGPSTPLFPIVGAGSNHFGIPPRRETGRSILRDPETHQVVESLAGQAIGLLLGSRDYLAADPIGSDDPEKARFMSRLLMAVLEEPGAFRTIFQLVKDSFLFSTSVFQAGWETMSRLQMVQEQTLSGKRIVPRDVVYSNRFRMIPIDIYDFYPDPSGTRIQEDMLFVAKRFRISKMQAQDLAKQGVYDKAGVNKAIEAAEKRSTDKHQRQRFPQQAKDTADKYGVMTGFEGWGQIPWLPPDKARNRVITILNGIHVRGHINPFIDGNIPFKEIVVKPIQGRFYGLGPAEVIRFLQDSANSLLMTFTDVANAAVTAPILVGQALGGDIEQIRRRDPLDVIPVRDVKQIARMPFEFNALQAAAAEMIRRKLSMREASGATNPIQAIQSPSSRTTATEFSEVVRLASQRVELQVQLIERDDFPWVGRTILSRLRQFLPEEGAIASLAGEQFAVTLDDIQDEADVRFMGSRHVMSRFQKTTGLGRAIEILSANPDFVAMMPDLVVRFLRDGTNDIDDADRIVETFVGQLQQFRQQEQQQALELQQSQAASRGTVSVPRSGGPETEATAASQAGQQVA